MSKPLSVANIRTAKPGDILRDADIPGLHLRVFPGKSVYYLHYRSPKERKPNGKPVERRYRLGAATSALTLPEARVLGRRTLSAVAEGRDPAMEKRTHGAESTIQDLYELAVKLHWSADRFVKSGWKANVHKLYEACIRKRFGGRSVSDPFDDVEDWHAEYKDRPYAGNRALAVLSTMLTLAEKKRFGRLRPLNSNPCSTVTKHHERSRDRYATPAEIAAIGPLLIKYADTWPTGVAFLYVLLFSGSRPSAIARATPDQLTEILYKGQTWGVLKFDGKTGPEVVYLPPQAMAVISKLPKVPGRPLVGKIPRKIWRIIRKEAGCPDLRMRDWRRTFATVGMSGGQAMQTISELLNHKSTQTTKVYAKLMTDKKMEAAGTISNSMEGLLQGAG